MKNAGKSSSWIKANYDKLSVVVVLVFIVASSGFLVLSINKESLAIREARGLSAPGGGRAEPKDLLAYNKLLQLAADPKVAAPATNLFMVSELRVESVNSKGIKAPIPYDAQICPFTNEPQPDPKDRDSDGDGMPDWWEEKYGLDPHNPEDAHLDLDGDGFTNLEEYLAGIDPTDPQSHPPIASKLRLLRVESVPFQMRFNGVQDLGGGEKHFQLNLRTLDRTYFVKLGDEVEGFVVEAYTENIVEREELGIVRKTDRSVLTLRKGDKAYELRINEVGSADEFFVHLVNLMDRSPHRRARDQDLELRGAVYKVVDIRPSMVVLRDQADNKEYPVGMLSQEERDILTGRDPRAREREGYPDSMMQPGDTDPFRPPTFGPTRPMMQRR